MYINEISYVKLLFQQHDTVCYTGALVRSRSQRFLFGEQPTHHSLDNEKLYALLKEIVEIVDEGCLHPGTQEIVNLFHRHYMQLFRKNIPIGDPSANETWVSLILVLDDEERSLMDGPVFLSEIEHAIDSLKSNDAWPLQNWRRIL